MVTAAAADALSELTCPFMGRLSTKSQFSLIRRPIPSPSEPMTRAIGPVRSVLQSGEAPLAAVP